MAKLVCFKEQKNISSIYETPNLAQFLEKIALAMSIQLKGLTNNICNGEIS
jgi:hypothetical protein